MITKLPFFGIEHFQITARFPLDRDFDKLPLEKQIKLCMISYRSFGYSSKQQSIASIQLHFTNGVRSPIFEGKAGRDQENIKEGQGSSSNDLK